jgi:hypothetical protein
LYSTVYPSGGADEIEVVCEWLPKQKRLIALAIDHRLVGLLSSVRVRMRDEPRSRAIDRARSRLAPTSEPPTSSRSR